MKRSTFILGFLFSTFLPTVTAQEKAHNPIIFADVPDVSMVRVGKSYYMSSTTMHMSPGVPIMKSDDLVNWKIVSYAYDRISEIDNASLNNGKNSYGQGSWASTIRFHNGLFYVSTFAQNTGKTYIFSTKDPEKGPWKRIEFEPMMHDHSFFFDDDGKAYMLYGGGKLKLVELKDDLSGIKPNSEIIAIENGSAPSGDNIGLPAEGSQLFKKEGKYYLFNITWPKGGMRTVVVHRADKLQGPWEGKVALQDLGVAQGGLIDTPSGEWYSYLFRDYGAVGRIPYWVPVKWEDGWPILGENGKVPTHLNLPANKSLIPTIVNSDEFSRKKNDAQLPLVWQWNHNPDNNLWSVSERKGYLRLKTNRIDTDFLNARNTLTQRTIGPTSTGVTSMDVTHLKEGDFAGLALLQKNYGQLGVKVIDGKKYIIYINGSDGNLKEESRIEFNQNKIYLKAACDFREKKDIAIFSYSLDGKNWSTVGSPLKMAYTLPHFMGYRFALFNYSTQQTGGYADFDYFRIKEGLDQ